MGKVLYVYGPLVQHEDVPVYGVCGVEELAQVERLILAAAQEEGGKEEEEGLLGVNLQSHVTYLTGLSSFTHHSIELEQIGGRTVGLHTEITVVSSP